MLKSKTFSSWLEEQGHTLSACVWWQGSSLPPSASVSSPGWFGRGEERRRPGGPEIVTVITTYYYISAIHSTLEEGGGEWGGSTMALTWIDSIHWLYSHADQVQTIRKYGTSSSLGKSKSGKSAFSISSFIFLLFSPTTLFSSRSLASVCNIVLIN